MLRKSVGPLYYIKLEQARANTFKFDWDNYLPPIPNKLGVEMVSVVLAQLVDYIDWTPFILIWSLARKYPRILQDDVVAKVVQISFVNAQVLLKTLRHNPMPKARGVVGIFLVSLL